jgi:hypothetical protein
MFPPSSLLHTELPLQPKMACVCGTCRPVKTYEMVVQPEEPWEEQIVGYNSVVQLSDTEVRIYYDNFGTFGRYICVAISHDGGVSYFPVWLWLCACYGHGCGSVYVLDTVVAMCMLRSPWL